MIKHDKAALEKLLADDLVYIHSSSKTETKAEVIQVIHPVRRHMNPLSSETPPSGSTET